MTTQDISLSRTQETHRPNATVALVLSYLIFMALGLPDALLGVAWATMRVEFGLELGALGILFVAGTAGYLLSTISVGKVLARYPFATVLVAASIVRALSLAGYALLPAWWSIAAVAFTLGFGGGFIDAGLNTWFAMRFGTRQMNWLHAAFGIGATIAPLMAGVLIANQLSWRWGYAVIALVQITLALTVYLTRQYWLIPPAIHTEAVDSPDTLPVKRTLLLPAVWMGIGLFALVGGAEMTTGNWSYSLFTESRGVTAAAATWWVGLYWGSFTIGRIVFGFVDIGASITKVLRGCLIGAFVGASLLAWAPVPWVAFSGLAILGFALAPLIPLFTTETPVRLGRAHAQNAIGFQYAAAGLGIAILPSIAGIWATRATLELEIVPYFLMGIAALLIILHEFWVRSSIQKQV